MPRDLHQIKHNVYQLQILSVIQVRSYLTLCFKFKLDSRLGFIFYALDETFVWDGLVAQASNYSNGISSKHCGTTQLTLPTW